MSISILITLCKFAPTLTNFNRAAAQRRTMTVAAPSVSKSTQLAADNAHILASLALSYGEGDQPGFQMQLGQNGGVMGRTLERSAGYAGSGDVFNSTARSQTLPVRSQSDAAAMERVLTESQVCVSVGAAIEVYCVFYN